MNTSTGNLLWTSPFYKKKCLSAHINSRWQSNVGVLFEWATELISDRGKRETYLDWFPQISIDFIWVLIVKLFIRHCKYWSDSWYGSQSSLNTVQKFIYWLTFWTSASSAIATCYIHSNLETELKHIFARKLSTSFFSGKQFFSLKSIKAYLLIKVYLIY